MGTTVLVASILDDGHVFQENRTPTRVSNSSVQGRCSRGIFDSSNPAYRLAPQHRRNWGS